MYFLNLCIGEVSQIFLGVYMTLVDMIYSSFFNINNIHIYISLFYVHCKKIEK